MENNQRIDSIPEFFKLSKEEQVLLIEALIFSSEEPISFEFLTKIILSEKKSILISDDFKDNELSEKFTLNKDFFENIINEINHELSISKRPYRIISIANGYTFATLEEYGSMLQRLFQIKNKKRLSQAALECLAIIAYKQPISKPEIEHIRGVNSNEIVNSLLEKNLILPVGRKDVLGKPMLYATTPEFLKIFGLNSLDDLPRLKEFEELNNDFDFSNIENNLSNNNFELENHNNI